MIKVKKSTKNQSNKIDNSDIIENIPQASKQEDLDLDSSNHISWDNPIPSKNQGNIFVEQNPNDFYEQNLKFLSGQNSPIEDPSTTKRPVFRLAFVLNAGKNQLAKAIHVPNSNKLSQIDNVPSDYYNIVDPDNTDNISIYFIDLVFEWTVNPEGKNELKPVWLPASSENLLALTNLDNQTRMISIKTMESYHLIPSIKKTRGIFYGSGNKSVIKMFRKMPLSYFRYDSNKNKEANYKTVYTIWFHKRLFGYDILEQLLKDRFSGPISDFKDNQLNKKVIDLFEFSDLISKQDNISKKNDIFLLFTKWLNYKNTTISSNTDQFNQKVFDSQKSEKITIQSFERLDDFFYFSVKCFINELDQCLYENYINKVGAKGLLLEDFFSGDDAVAGTAQDLSQQGEDDFIDEIEKSKAKKTKRNTKSKPLKSRKRGK